MAVHVQNFAGWGKFVAGAVALLGAAVAVVVTVALFTANFGTKADDTALRGGLPPTVRAPFVVRERERERESARARERERVCVRACVISRVCACTRIQSESLFRV
jgi:hypothetical protein